MSDSYDAVIIGSGLGGLTAAACLAREGKRVCVIERHSSPGGSASTYKLGSAIVEAALHESSNPNNPIEPKHHILKKLGILDALEWVPVGPIFEARGGPLGSEPFVLGHGFDQVREDFRTRFPGSARGSKRVLDDMQHIAESLGTMMTARQEGSLIKLARGLAGMAPMVTGWHKSLAEKFDAELGEDEAAKCALAANLPYYANDPSTFWWIAFAVAQGGFIEAGGTYIKGGSAKLSAKLVEVIEAAGGTVMLGREGSHIDIGDDGEVEGIRHREPGGADESRIATGLVLANCAPSAVAGMLGERWKGEFAAPHAEKGMSTSLFTIHYVLGNAPENAVPKVYSSMLLPDWMTKFSDYAQAGELLGTDPRGRMPPVAIVNYNAIDSGIGAEGKTVVTITGIDRLSNWEGLGPDQIKARRAVWMDAFTGCMEEQYPGFAGAIEASDFLDARSMHNYLGTPEGAVYGFAPAPPTTPIWKGIGRSPKTAIPGLFLASAFGGGGGFTGAMGTGWQAAEMVSEFLADSKAG